LDQRTIALLKDGFAASRTMPETRFTVVLDKDENLFAFRKLKESLQNDASIFREHKLGHQGGTRVHTVYWRPESNLWAVLEQSPPTGPQNRFWNCFGIENPGEKSVLEINVEINPPHEGENRRIEGLFVRDQDNRIYIAHDGKFTNYGGRNAFRQFLGDASWPEIQTQRGSRTPIVLGPIDDESNFVKRLSDYVHNVVDFKKQQVR
jgi:hypothetical protein